MGMGAFPPPRSAVKAAGSAGSSKSTDQITLLQNISDGIWRLVKRLAPTSFRQRFTITALGIGDITPPQVINAPDNQFNAMNVNLTTGIVNIYIANTLIYQVQATVVPYVIMMSVTPVNGQITFECDGLSPTAADGTIDLIQL